MEQINPKYPRTYHLPYSPGTTSDDRILHGEWFKHYEGKEIVITEKLDGENTAMTRDDVYARTHAVATRTSLENMKLYMEKTFMVSIQSIMIS